MNLKEALGIVSWQSIEGQEVLTSEGTDNVPFVSHAYGDVWCVGEELVDCWAVDDDPRWQLLINMARAVGITVEQLQPADIEDVPAGERLWLFDGQTGLPYLQAMLEQTAQKSVAWKHLCLSTKH